MFTCDGDRHGNRKQTAERYTKRTKEVVGRKDDFAILEMMQLLKSQRRGKRSGSVRARELVPGHRLDHVPHTAAFGTRRSCDVRPILHSLQSSDLRNNAPSD